MGVFAVAGALVALAGAAVLVRGAGPASAPASSRPPVAVAERHATLTRCAAGASVLRREARYASRRCSTASTVTVLVVSSRAQMMR